MDALVKRLATALLLAIFCAPLFVGLGRTDVGHDEAIYSFAVDRMLETGDWLVPKSSPHEDVAFLEKPPLKLWIVAASIRLGILPHNEFGIRFWDALCGAVAFLYVFAIGVRLAGPLCGAVALLILFVHWPLLFEHGIRSNNMEAPLVLCYCGSVFHYLRWMAADDERRGGRHAVIVGLYFALGFMTKSVAALFLPLVLSVTSLLFRNVRVRFARDCRLWSGVAALALALIVPWFVFAYRRFGSELWQGIFGDVYVRFTASLDPAHVQPWHFYLTEVHRWLVASDSHLLVSIGLVLLVVQARRRRWLEGTVVVLWFALPTALMSAGTSKLYHYIYPFLPPLALAGGFLASLVVTLATALGDRGLQVLDRYTTAHVPFLVSIRRRPAVRALLRSVVVVAAGAAAITILYEPIRLTLGRFVVFRSSGIVRPMIVVVLFGILAGDYRHTSRIVVALIVASMLPLQAYRETLPRFTVERHPMRTASECLVRVEPPPGAIPGLYLDDRYVSHPLYYYFRRVRPVTRTPSPDLTAINRYLFYPSEWRPMLLWDSTYQDFMRARASSGPRPTSPPMIAFSDVLLLLPGPYEQCSAPSAISSRHGSR
jgi:4-amino-4-deoxy-L-arabinose transferase-like glycosyltransferase